MDYEDYLRMGGVSGNLTKARQGELRRLHRAQQRPAAVCRVCGEVSCSKPSCLRAIMAAEQDRDFRRRLQQHADAAAREAGPYRNGGGGGR